MKKILIGASTIGLSLATFGAGTASAAQPDDPGRGGKCAAAGTQYLRDNDLLVAVAQDGLGDFSSLGAVVKAHTKTPDAFPWCS